MQANMLDDLFIKTLKDQSRIPDNVTFRKDRIFESLENRLDHKSNRKWKLAVAILVLLLGSSVYFHYQQYCNISNQGNKMLNQSNLISLLETKNENSGIENRLLRDSITKWNLMLVERTKRIQLPQLPTIVINQPIVFKNAIEEQLYIPVQITERVKLKETESKLPELDLPVFYESDRLASRTEASIDSKSFAKKIGKLFKN